MVDILLVREIKMAGIREPVTKKAHLGFCTDTAGCEKVS